MKLLELYALLAAILLFSCSGSTSRLSTEEMLNLSGRVKLPTQEEYPDDGAVVLYENEEIEFFLDDDWNKNVRTTYSIAILYFNDKAEDWLTHSIYLNSDISLNHFSARTIKPNGEVIELTEKDLLPAHLSPDFVEFSDEKSLKFTFPAVEKGAILEYTVEKLNTDAFYSGDTWYIQSDIPKLYSRYSIEIPDIYVINDIGWNIRAVNLELPPAKILKNLGKRDSRKDKSKIYYWIVREIPALHREPNSPPYRDIGIYARIGVNYKNWNELTDHYWKAIKDKFDPEEHPEVAEKAEELTRGLESDREKIEAIFDYVQKDYRYVAIEVDESGYIPHSPEEIMKNRYGDCKDMTVLNVSMLRALGIDARPALVNTKGKGETLIDLVSLDFNHMIALAQSGKENYWLDATGSSCPLGEVYPSIEGVDALVINPDGTSKFMRIPESQYAENKTVRKVEIHIDSRSNVSGKVELRFRGNENVSIRSELKGSNYDDIRKAIAGYVNRNTPGINVDDIQYDDPEEITDSFTIKFNFKKEAFGSKSGDLMIFRPEVFSISSRLDKYREEERKYPLVFPAPYMIKDIVKIYYDPKKYKVKAKPRIIRKKYAFGRISSVCSSLMDGEISYRREFILEKNKISPVLYKKFLDMHKLIAEIEEENIVLEKISSF
jgi:transglutaminase-like putative cysteine protease